MYLTVLNQFRPGPGHWPKNVAATTDVMECLFTYADAEFNSARWAHEEFEHLQPLDRVAPSPYLHRSWTNEVMKVAANSFGPMCAPGLYPCETVAWALIDMWIKVRLAATPPYEVPEHLRRVAQEVRKHHV